MLQRFFFLSFFQYLFRFQLVRRLLLLFLFLSHSHSIAGLVTGHHVQIVALLAGTLDRFGPQDATLQHDHAVVAADQLVHPAAVRNLLRNLAVPQRSALHAVLVKHQHTVRETHYTVNVKAKLQPRDVLFTLLGRPHNIYNLYDVIVTH